MSQSHKEFYKCLLSWYHFWSSCLLLQHLIEMSSFKEQTFLFRYVVLFLRRKVRVETCGVLE